MSSELLDAGWPLLEALVVPVAKTEELWDVSSISYTFCTFFGQKKHKDISDSKIGRRNAIIPLGKRSRNIWLMSRQMD